MCLRVELPDGTYTLAQEGASAAELNYTAVQEAPSQSSEEPKAVVEEEGEGKHRLHQPNFLTWQIYLCLLIMYAHLSFRSCYETLDA